MSQSPFQDPATRVKINPETYVKFDGSDQLLLKNIHSQDGISVKYDIMLILYELIDWKTVGELIAPWPPDDQEKIKSHLDMLASRHIVITNEADAATLSESGLSEHLGRHIHINVENHHAMLRDYVRMAAYRRAIENAVTPDTLALDLGCGSGILSFFTVSAGAKKVYAIERRPDVILLAEELAKANNLADRIEFIEGSSSQIASTQIDPKPTLLVAEILGNGILEENVLEFTMDARRRFLAPNAQLIPYGIDIYFFGFDSGMNVDRRQEVTEFKDLYGYDFTLLADVLCNKATTRLDRYSPHISKTMTEPILAKAVDLRTLEDAVFAEKFTLVAQEDGVINSVCGYFKAHLDAENILTNSPWAPSTHWTHLIYTLASPEPVKKGDTLMFEVVYDGNLRIHRLQSP
jgi:SAM-dependent methyltransferase